jgi:ferredoxin-NADP reductase
MTEDLDVIVTDRRPIADGVAALTLGPAGSGPLPCWEPGAHIDLVLGPDLVRQYSLCGDPADRREWRIAVLREPGGRGGSVFVHETLAVGARLRARGPRNRFPLVRSSNYLFVAGGIGITPILPMVHAVDRAGAAWNLVYGGRRRDTMAFLADLAPYGNRVAVRPQDEYGLLDLDAVLGRPQPQTVVYCCGPEPLLTAVIERCRTWPDGVLHLERFAPDGAAGEPVGVGAAFEVVLATTGQVVAVPSDTSILHAVERAGVQVLSSCREGTCGTCETGVLEGIPDHRDSVLTAAERAVGDVMMICVSRARGGRLVLDL